MKIGDRVQASMAGEVWFEGVWATRSDCFAEYGVILDGEIEERYFLMIRPCHGTGEVESRSVQRREALQKGEPMPTFDKPEMPERICGCPYSKNREMELQWVCEECGNRKSAATFENNSLPADKVRELVRAVDVLRNYAWDCMEGRKQTEKFVKLNCPVESLINALFPEGVEE